MTPPQYPFSPPPQHQPIPAFGPVPVRVRRSRVDVILTAAMSTIAVGLAIGCVFLSIVGLFAGQVDCADQTNNCNDAMFTRAYQVLWGGIAIAGIVGLSGTVIAAVRRWVMWIWPTLASGLIIIAFVVAKHLFNLAHPGWAF
jgi:hypothetical protein